MPEYEVSWTIELEAPGPVEAARAALAIHRNPASWATVFTVRSDTEDVTVDLDPEHTDPSGHGTRT
ncbi:hypothetical protein [Streptomyces drozdowiczii]|uniref:Uncharacterized protein n=1 Tax=Streptomyces drozdowiczii TaxID=202862 RepID=A0ABY6Q154_9ACTN|nr:hypothetical protein [Streptomyces drozdowiczii]MCX0248018.1 hypothetical protein [Streptomyces drozdowiczii]UZK58280.1 hypothetical protein NEH16_33125 [Streptomyces drozdowiczii]